MGVVPLGRRVETVKGYQLLTPEDMIDALKFLAGTGYTGHINLSLNGATPQWDLGLQSSGQGVSQSATIGDWIVLKNNTAAEIVKAAQFASLYTAP